MSALIQPVAAPTSVAPTAATAPPRPRRKRAERSASTRERLIAAAIDALHRFGYAATSTVLVADRAGVSRGAMLHQYGTKAEMMVAVVKASFDADIAAYEQALADVRNPRTRIETLIDVGWTRFKSPAGVARTEIWMATRSDAQLAAHVLPLQAEEAERTVEQWTRMVRHAGIDDPTLSKALLRQTVATLRGLALELILGTPEDEVDACVALAKAHVIGTLTFADVAGRFLINKPAGRA
jgi:AcrR family transcriptional regulator